MATAKSNLSAFVALCILKQKFITANVIYSFRRR